jgi:hypothetical protein
LTDPVAVVDEGQRLNELTGDAGTAAESNTAITEDADYSAIASLVNRYSRE